MSDFERMKQLAGLKSVSPLDPFIIKESANRFPKKWAQQSFDDTKRRVYWASVDAEKEEEDRKKVANSIAKTLSSHPTSSRRLTFSPRPSFVTQSSNDTEAGTAIIAALLFLSVMSAMYIGKIISPHAKKAAEIIVKVLKQRDPYTWDNVKLYLKKNFRPKQYQKDQEEKARKEAEEIERKSKEMEKMRKKQRQNQKWFNEFMKQLNKR